MKKVLISGLLVLGFSTIGFAADEAKNNATTNPAAQAAQQATTKQVAAQNPATEAGDYSDVACKNGANVRKVEIATGQTGCEVHYKKQSEQPGHDQVLWNSKSDATYCKTKAKEFVAKLAGWGWNCGGEQAKGTSL